MSFYRPSMPTRVLFFGEPICWEDFLPPLPKPSQLTSSLSSIQPATSSSTQLPLSSPLYTRIQPHTCTLTHLCCPATTALALDCCSLVSPEMKMLPFAFLWYSTYQSKTTVDAQTASMNQELISTRELNLPDGVECSGQLIHTPLSPSTLSIKDVLLESPLKTVALPVCLFFMS